MASATNYLRTKWLQHMLGIAAWTMPTTVYYGLTTTPPSAAAGGAEPSAAAGYVRRPATMAMDDGGRPDLAENSATIEWPAATAPWGIVAWFEIWDSPIGGNRLAWGELVDATDLLTLKPIEVISGDQVRIPTAAANVVAI